MGRYEQRAGTSTIETMTDSKDAHHVRRRICQASSGTRPSLSHDCLSVAATVAQRINFIPPEGSRKSMQYKVFGSWMSAPKIMDVRAEESVFLHPR